MALGLARNKLRPSASNAQEMTNPQHLTALLLRRVSAGPSAMPCTFGQGIVLLQDAARQSGSRERNLQNSAQFYNDWASASLSGLATGRPAKVGRCPKVTKIQYPPTRFPFLVRTRRRKRQLHLALSVFVSVMLGTKSLICILHGDRHKLARLRAPEALNRPHRNSRLGEPKPSLSSSTARKPSRHLGMFGISRESLLLA